MANNHIEGNTEINYTGVKINDLSKLYHIEKTLLDNDTDLSAFKVQIDRDGYAIIMCHFLLSNGNDTTFDIHVYKNDMIIYSSYYSKLLYEDHTLQFSCITKVKRGDIIKVFNEDNAKFRGYANYNTMDVIVIYNS